MTISQIARYLILLTAALLAYFGLGTMMNLGSHPELAGVFVAYALAMFIESAVLLFCYFRLRKRGKRIFWLAVILLAVNILVTIFDQIGLIDIAYMMLNLVALVTLYLSRKEFLPE